MWKGPKSLHLRKGKKDRKKKRDGQKTKRALCWWWNQLKRFDIDLFFYFSFFLFSFSLRFPPRCLSLIGSRFYRAHGARERVIDQPDYFPAPIIITGCNRLRPPQHRFIFCPFFYFFLFFFYLRTYMGSFRVLLVESPAVARLFFSLRPWYPFE